MFKLRGGEGVRNSDRSLFEGKAECSRFAVRITDTVLAQPCRSFVSPDICMAGYWDIFPKNLFRYRPLTALAYKSYELL